VKVFSGRQTRQEYVDTQIARSRSKVRYCKVSIRDVLRYRVVLLRDRALRRAPGGPGPVLCLGTRSGREVDLFRVGLFGGRLRRRAAALAEIKRNSYLTLAPPLEAAGRSHVDRLDATSVIGVEINPDAARRDVWIGSFDDMPADWAGRFGVVFSNSFDQSQDPHRTAREWRRVVRPGGYLITCFDPTAQPNAHDPVGQISLADLQELFGGELVFFRHRGSRKGYSETILRVPEAGRQAP
jgi:SAM-dependent methyltransferase